MKRTYCLETVEKVGQKVILKGWVNGRRDMGKIVFIDLRDRTGIVQLVCGSEVKALRSEFVVEVTGEVVERTKKDINPDIETGKVEIKVSEIKVLNKAETLPFDVYGDGLEIDEAIRLQHRYLDLRRPRLVNNLILRDKVISFIREFLHKNDFLEVATPILTKTTPEGARDFIVPSRLQKGKFYALPQSPQQYKQLLIVAGIERYFQVARCFRDEDPRSDRAYGEFTQLDLEMAFVEQEDILKLTEELFTTLTEELFPEKKILKTPWPRISHKEAIAKYGSDKPDLRTSKKDRDELAFCWITDFPLFVEQTEEDFYYGLGEVKYAPSHHMFTAPHPDDISLLDTAPLKVRSLQHDMVLNGYEIGGGSIRIHDPKLQVKIFDLIGFKDEQKQQFSHMLEAFKYGVPPHGGVAPGLDRFLFAALGEKSLREVIAFPATSSGRIAVMDAPSKATAKQLEELGIQVVGEENED